MSYKKHREKAQIELKQKKKRSMSIGEGVEIFLKEKEEATDRGGVIINLKQGRMLWLLTFSA